LFLQNNAPNVPLHLVELNYFLFTAPC